MEYNWSLEKLSRQKRQLKALLRKTNGLTHQEKETIKESIEYLTEMSSSILLKKDINFSFFKNPKYLDSNHLLTKENYLIFEEIPLYLIETILKATSCFKKLHDNYDDLEPPKMNLSNQDLVALSHDFYRWLPNKNYVKAFDFYTDPNRCLLHFNKNGHRALIGETTFFYYPIYRPYFLIDRDQTINDFLTLNHEIAHGIMYKYDTITSINNHHYYLMELEGTYFDFLSIEYLKQFMGEDIIHELEYSRFTSSYDDFIIFYITTMAVNLFKRKKDISITSIEEKILKHELPFYIDETILLESLSTNLKIITKYLLSYLVSLDLEMLYEKDPEYSFHTFEQIRNNKTNDLFKNLEDNNISFIGETENYRPLQKTIQKMNNLGSKDNY